jgi:hypothetical protein
MYSMFMVCLLTELHMSSSNCSLATSSNRELNELSQGQYVNLHSTTALPQQKLLTFPTSTIINHFRILNYSGTKLLIIRKEKLRSSNSIS